jgi:hypothetical protein
MYQNGENMYQITKNGCKIVLGTSCQNGKNLYQITKNGFKIVLGTTYQNGKNMYQIMYQKCHEQSQVAVT